MALPSTPFANYQRDTKVLNESVIKYELNVFRNPYQYWYLNLWHLKQDLLLVMQNLVNVFIQYYRFLLSWQIIIADVICENITADSSNLTVSVGSLAYLTTINYTCLEGHYFDDNSSIHISMCNASEEWTIPASEDQICSRKLLIM